MVLHRLRILAWIFVALFLAVEARLAHLQFSEREFWELEGRKARLEGRAVPFKRGALLDRHGRVLAEGRQVHNLTFTYQLFRRETAIGRLMGAGALLAEHGRLARAPALTDVLADPQLYASAVLELSEAALETLTGTAQSDLRYYGRCLLGMGELEFRARREAAPPETRWASFAREPVAAVAERVRAQVDHLQELARCADADPGEFLSVMETAVVEMDGAFHEATRSRALTPGQLRGLRKDYEAREQTLLRVLPYRAVFLVNLVPDRYVGFAVRDVDARWYPEEVRDVAPKLIGWTGFPTEAVLDLAEKDQLEFDELRARPPEEIEIETAERIETLRQRLRYFDYRRDEEMGRAGLEALLEPALRGTRGWRVVEQDRGQNATRLLDYRPASPGRDVTLTLDTGLQVACERVLGALGLKASIVLVDPRDGAIRAMATSPQPTREDIRRRYSELALDESDPLIHRGYEFARGDPPAPGSVFKLVVAAAALEAGKITADTRLECARYYPVGDRTFKCLGHHGSITVDEALEKSCNVFFYRVAAMIGVEPMIAMARRVGLGEPSGFGDAKKLGMPFPAVSILEVARLFEETGRGFAIQTAIGHGAVGDVTTLQIATFVAPFANGGLRIRPYLVDAIGDDPAPRDNPTPVGLSARTVDIVRRGMRKVTETGTARPEKAGVDLAALGVVGKTGTPQSDGAQHATFAGYFPVDAPRIVFAILVEDVREDQGGGGVCAPIMGQLVRQPELREHLGRGLR